jgi:nitrite reductase (NADH) small subunit
MAKSVLIGSVDQIPPGEGRNFIVELEQIAVFRTHAGEVYATQAMCPHRSGPLADGLLGGATIVCPLHDRTFDLRTGQGVGPDCANLKIYQIALTQDSQMLITI